MSANEKIKILHRSKDFHVNRPTELTLMDVDVLDNSGSKTVLVNKKLLESKKILSMESDPYDHSSTIIQADEIGNDNIRVEEDKLNSTHILNQENPESAGNLAEIRNTEQPSGKILEKITFASRVLPSGRRKKLEFDPRALKESIDSIRKSILSRPIVKQDDDGTQFEGQQIFKVSNIPASQGQNYTKEEVEQEHEEDYKYENEDETKNQKEEKESEKDDEYVDYESISEIEQKPIEFVELFGAPLDSSTLNQNQTSEQLPIEAKEENDDGPQFDVSNSMFDMLQYLKTKPALLTPPPQSEPKLPAKKQTESGPRKELVIEYRNKRGHLLTTKQAWKEYNWKFHKNKPKNPKKKISKDQKQKNNLSTGFSLAKLNNAKK